MGITRTRGDTYADQFLVTMNKTSQPANLSGCTFKMTLSKSSAPDSTAAPVYQLDGVVSDPTAGLVEFSPTAIQSDQLGSFYFDIQMTDALGRIRTLTIGTYDYTQDITK